MSLDLRRVLCSQADVRSVAAIAEMIDHVRRGGEFSQHVINRRADRTTFEDEPLVCVSVFEDGLEMIHDGHHRAVSCILGGRDHLRDSEYFRLPIAYRKYTDIDLHDGWLTPFDPRSELRVADLSGFKERALRLAEEDEAAAARYILENPLLYKLPRHLFGIADLAEVVRPRLKAPA
jgi:hypothetical protein